MVLNPKTWKKYVARNTEDNMFVFEKSCLKNNNDKIAIDNILKFIELMLNTSQSSIYYQELNLS